jgi:hypothetical protein
MWLIAEYQPTALFSLKTSMATASGAKTLFLPTPFAIKMALLDVAIRTWGVAVGREVFPWLAKMSIAVLPARQVVVTNLFTKVLKPRRGEAATKGEGDKEGEGEAETEETPGPFQKTIAFREYVHLEGRLVLAFEVNDQQSQELSGLLPQVNYFGKRGSFFQLAVPPQAQSVLPTGFVPLAGFHLDGLQVTGQSPSSFALTSLIQVLDDCGPGLTFEKADIYSDEKIVVGKDRVRKSIVLPYRLVRSSKSFSYYERI